MSHVNALIQWLAAEAHMTPQQTSDAIVGTIMVLSLATLITNGMVLYLLGYKRGLEARIEGPK